MCVLLVSFLLSIVIMAVQCNRRCCFILFAFNRVDSGLELSPILSLSFGACSRVSSSQPVTGSVFVCVCLCERENFLTICQWEYTLSHKTWTEQWYQPPLVLPAHEEHTICLCLDKILNNYTQQWMKNEARRITKPFHFEISPPFFHTIHFNLMQNHMKLD